MLATTACAEHDRPLTSPDRTEPDDAAIAASTITSADVRTRVAFLASDALRGRDTPSPGLETAAAYLAGEFQRLGLEPAGDGGSYIQRYTLTPILVAAGSIASGVPAGEGGGTANVAFMAGPRAASAFAGGSGPAAAGAASTSESRPPNVAAVLRGSDPTLRDTYVVFSAHFDHLGVGKPDATGDSIYNGADDNASGTAAVVEIAEAFASLAEPPARSILFLAVSGEEKGLLGSAYFTAHPTVPIASMVADINLDMVGRNAPDSVIAVGLDYTSLGPEAEDAATGHPELGLTVAPDLWPQEHLFFRSDHFNFARREVPAIFLTTGGHPDYHRPSDELERLDTDKNARVARLAFYLGLAVASSPDPPEWTAAGRAAMQGLIGP